MKVLVTGGNGQLGRAFQSVFPDGKFLTRADLDLSAERGRIRPLFRQYLKESKAELVLHCGAYTKVDLAETERKEATAVNYTATDVLAQACLRAGVPLIYFSTDYVFDGSSPRPYREMDPPHPQSAYGWSKREGEGAVLRASSGFAVIRLSYVFGDGDNLVKALLRASEKSLVRGVSDQLFRPTYAVDVAESLGRLIKSGVYPSGILHLQNEGQPTSVANYAREIYRQVDQPTEVMDTSMEEFNKGRDGIAPRPKNSIFDLALARKLGISMPTWKSAVGRYLATL